jgi:hypothetical protein
VPTRREREYYAMGFRDGLKAPYTEDYQVALGEADSPLEVQRARRSFEEIGYTPRFRGRKVAKPKRKLSAWQKFVKANSRKKEFRYRDGKLNLKKMGVAYRRKKRR